MPGCLLLGLHLRLLPLAFPIRLRGCHAALWTSQALR